MDEFVKLAELKARFNPKRRYECDGFVIEVDAVFLRIDDDLEKSVDKKNGTLEIKLEDILQDPSIIRSARVSTGRDLKDVNEKAEGLIGALYKGRHETPFEGGVMFRLKVTTPISTAQPFFQLYGSHNEFSGRYSVIDGDFYVPYYAKINLEIAEIFEQSEKESNAIYRELLEMGVANEQARFALPFRFFTKFYWTVSLRHILELLSLEKNKATPEEFWTMRDEILEKLIKDWTPWTYDEYRKNNKKIPTQWIEEEGADPLQGVIMKQTSIENIGDLALIDVYGTEKLLRLGVRTKPNPRKGFGHAGMSFFMGVPIFVHRQWVRHRYGAWSELPVNFDGTVAVRNFYIPTQFRKLAGKQMGYKYEDLSLSENEIAREKMEALTTRSIDRYKKLRNLKLSASQASLVLPYTFRIPVIWTANVESLMNYFSLRCDMHAQWETRQYALKVYEWFKEYFPWADEMFMKHYNFGVNGDLWKDM